MHRIVCALIACAFVTAVGCKGDERAAKPLVTDAQRKAEPPPTQTTQPQPQPTGNSQALTGRVKDDRPKSLVGTIRGRGARTERMNEMRTLGQYYLATEPPPRTVDAFLNELKVQAPGVYKEIKDGNYIINPKALGRRVPGDGIIAYEVEADLNGWYVVKGDGSVDAIPPDQLKAALDR